MKRSIAYYVLCGLLLAGSAFIAWLIYGVTQL